MTHALHQQFGAAEQMPHKSLVLLVPGGGTSQAKLRVVILV